jgi:hypothetical protein
MPRRCVRCRHRPPVILGRFKVHAVGRDALDQPIGLTVIDLSTVMPVADRLLHIGADKAPLVEATQRVRCPDESFDRHPARLESWPETPERLRRLPEVPRDRRCARPVGGVELGVAALQVLADRA